MYGHCQGTRDSTSSRLPTGARTAHGAERALRRTAAARFGTGNMMSRPASSVGRHTDPLALKAELHRGAVQRECKSGAGRGGRRTPRNTCAAVRSITIATYGDAREAGWWVCALRCQA